MRKTRTYKEILIHYLTHDLIASIQRVFNPSLINVIISLQTNTCRQFIDVQISLLLKNI